MLQYILLIISVIWSILCVISTVTECIHIKTGKIRNFFRRIRISLREVTLAWTIVIVGFVVYFAVKSENTNWIVLFLTLGMFLSGLVILEYFRILGLVKSRKFKKRSELCKKLSYTERINNEQHL